MEKNKLKSKTILGCIALAIYAIAGVLSGQHDVNTASGLLMGAYTAYGLRDAMK